MSRHQKSYFEKRYIFLFLGVLVLIAGFFGYQSYADRQLEQEKAEEAIEAFEESIPSKCENGEWIEFSDLENAGQYEKFAGNLKLKYDGEKETFGNEDGTQLFSTDEDHSLFFFMDREVRIEGYKTKDNEIYAKKIKCVGEEADQEILQTRRKLMDYIRDNINTLAPEKAPKRDWQVRVFYFANDTDLYVQYESDGSFAEEAPYDSRLWLIRVSKAERSVPLIQTLAYIHEDAEDPEKNILKRGTDLYADAKNLTVYEFEEEADQWVLQ